MVRLTVGEAAKAIGVSTKAVRLWETKGLIPRVERTLSGYRTFTDADLATMRFVHQARTLGLTLGEIRDILQLQHVGASPCDRVTQVIDGHLSAIDVSIANLLQLRQALRAAKTIADSRRPDHNGGGVCHIIERADAARDAVS